MKVKYKKLSKSRSISVPKDMAVHLDMKAGQAVDLTATDDGKLIISKHTETCRFCGGENNIHRYKDMYICPICATDMYREVSENG